MIPKKIHYCWFGKAEYPPLVKECIDSWVKNMPDWEIVKWDESNAPIEHKFVNKALRENQYAFAADYTRIYALEKFGGLYLDTDVEVVKSFIDLLDSDFFIGYENIDDTLLGTAVIGAKKNHPVLKEILEWYDKHNFYLPNPKIITPIVENFTSIDFLVSKYSYEYFYPYNMYDKERAVHQLMYKNVGANTYAIHHWAYSWKPSIFVKLIRYIKNYFSKIAG